MSVTGHWTSGTGHRMLGTGHWTLVTVHRFACRVSTQDLPENVMIVAIGGNADLMCFGDLGTAVVEGFVSIVCRAQI